jgi:hypothetical protein
MRKNDEKNENEKKQVKVVVIIDKLKIVSDEKLGQINEHDFQACEVLEVIAKN